MVANASMYGFNPYMMSSTGLNDDFMANATGFNNQYAALAQQQALMQQYQLAQQPATDTFQKSEGSSGLSSGLKLAAVGGVGAGAGAYFFGDKLGTVFTKDGKTFSDDILKAFETNPQEIAEANYATQIAAKEKAIIESKGFTIKNYDAVKTYVTTPVAERANLPKEITDLVPDGVKSNPDNFKAKILDVDTAIKNVDKDGKIAKQIIKDAQAGNLAYQTEELANLAKRKSLVEGLAKDATPAQIEELITKNPKVFGIEKTVEAEIQAEAKTIAQRYATKAGAIAEVTPLVTSTENSVKNIRTTLNSQVASHWDDAAKAFRADAPDVLKNAAKNFKWAKAGKFAAIAAGAGLVLGCLFGGNKS